MKFSSGSLSQNCCCIYSLQAFGWFQSGDLQGSDGHSLNWKLLPRSLVRSDNAEGIEQARVWVRLPYNPHQTNASLTAGVYKPTFFASLSSGPGKFWTGHCTFYTELLIIGQKSERPLRPVSKNRIDHFAQDWSLSRIAKKSVCSLRHKMGFAGRRQRLWRGLVGRDD